MKRTTIAVALGAVAALGIAVFATNAARPALLRVAKLQAPASDPSWQSIVSDRAALAIDVVQADARQVAAETTELELGLQGAGPVYRQYSKRNADGTLTWYGTIGKDFGPLDRLRAKATGEVANDPNNSVMLVRNGDRLTGTIRKDGQLYALRPLRSGGHALVRIDESKMPADHPSAYALLPRIDMTRAPARAKAKPQGEISTQAVSTIRVMVVATQSAVNASGDIAGLVNLAVAETNQGYANSGVEISLVLAGRYTTSYVESGSFSTDLSRFRGTTDGYMDSYHTTRNSIAADVGVLIINNSSSCGLASGIGSTASTAFAAVHWSCATGYYSFGHEIGHLQSARHDIATDGTLTPYAYGHGYRSPTNAWRTIMAYNCSPSCPRINYWSNPLRTYGGQAMGNTTRADNARVLNTTKGTIAAFR